MNESCKGTRFSDRTVDTPAMSLKPTIPRLGEARQLRRT